jgi:hypothetical protein
MSEAENKDEAKKVILKGFTLLCDESGVIKLTPINVNNELELIGFLAYANQKKEELLNKVCNSPETKTLEKVNGLTDVLSKVFSLAQKQIEEAKVPG